MLDLIAVFCAEIEALIVKSQILVKIRMFRNPLWALLLFLRY